MSILKRDTESFMTQPVTTGGKLTSTFRFPQHYLGFQGHFPARKILPGACQIQCVLSTIESMAGSPVLLREIVLAKYFAPVFPEEELHCLVTEVGDRLGDPTFKASLNKGDQKVTELKLRVSLAGAGKEQRTP